MLIERLCVLLTSEVVFLCSTEVVFCVVRCTEVVFCVVRCTEVVFCVSAGGDGRSPHRGCEC